MALDMPHGDLVYGPESRRLYTVNGFGSMWVARVLGSEHPARVGGWHDVTAEEWSRLCHCYGIGRINPFTKRHNAIRPMVQGHVTGYKTLRLH